MIGLGGMTIFLLYHDRFRGYDGISDRFRGYDHISAFPVAFIDFLSHHCSGLMYLLEREVEKSKLVLYLLE